MAAKYDRNSAVHRRIRMNMRGEDVKKVQRAVRLRLSRKGRPYKQVVVDGDFGPTTWSAWCTAAYDCGFDHRFCTPGNQRLMRDPSKRPARMKKLEDKRLAARKAAAKRAERGPEAAVAWWGHHLNVKENPAGSNGGGQIDVWQRTFGFIHVAWCGIFAGMGLRAAGVKVTSRVASVALIEDDAKAGRNGFSRWANKYDGGRGWLAVIGGRGVHVEGIVHKYSWGYLTRGGNTSCEGCTGSQSDGGQSAQRNRGWGAVYGCARPAY